MMLELRSAELGYVRISGLGLRCFATFITIVLYHPFWTRSRLGEAAWPLTRSLCNPNSSSWTAPPGLTPRPSLCSHPTKTQPPRGNRPLLPEPISRASGAGPRAPALLSGYQLVSKAVAHKVALCTRLPPSLSGKSAVGPRRPTALEERLGEQPGSEGRRNCKEEEADEEESSAQPEASPSRTKWRRWRRANCEAGLRPSPPPPPPSRRPGRSGGARSPLPARAGMGGERPGPLCKASGAAAPWQRFVVFSPLAHSVCT
ncbi:translation initiation factor IF-2 [Phyllostomus discolor]|uniref:Translation initiation factor IF-2 n=1 Tax=Phyllostomus discolor TaxID=89673 RepID=A0A7E6E8E6_9CHIR|nr:translation initiation factor IF-2 [Phyllostomus discolor]